MKALARAFRYQRMLDQGKYALISEMAAAEKQDRGYMGRAADAANALHGAQHPVLSEGGQAARLAFYSPGGWC
jgi:hypothetical protein